MTNADSSQDHAKRVSVGVHPLWRVVCLAMVVLNVGAAVWWYVATSVQSKAVVREIASRCNMDAVFPSMIVPQDGDLIVFVDADNSREDIEALAEIVGRLGREPDRQDLDRSRRQRLEHQRLCIRDGALSSVLGFRRRLSGENRQEIHVRSIGVASFAVVIEPSVSLFERGRGMEYMQGLARLVWRVGRMFEI